MWQQAAHPSRPSLWQQHRGRPGALARPCGPRRAARPARHVPPSSLGAAAAGADADAAADDGAAPAPPARVDALLVGGGPGGLAAALMLAGRGYNVTVAERHAQVGYSDPDRSYVYAIDGRGRRFTDKHGVTGRLADAAVDTRAVSVTRVFADGRASTSRQVIKDEARVVHWLPRNSFVRLLEYAALEEPAASYVSLLTNTEAVAIERAPGGGGGGGGGARVHVRLRNTVTGNEAVFEPALLLGCDGAKSAVREALASWAAEDAAGRSFSMVSFPSLSTDLRFKVLQLPPNPRMADGTALANPGFCLLAGRRAPSIGGPPLRLGLLPIRDETAGRTANLITLPDHPVWRVTSGEEMYRVFAEAFPQADWRALVPPPVMEKFAASRGGQFPAPQYSDGLSTVVGADAPAATAPDAPPVKGCGVALLGDAAHCFPPDLGQGVNSALEDVCVLEQQLEAAGDDLTRALPAYEQQRLPDAAALAKLVQIGFPLQYNQYPLLRALWNVSFFAQVLAHKLLPFLVAPPLFLMVQDPARRYSEVLRATERSRAAVAALGAAALAALAWAARRLLAGVATGGAAAA